MVRPSQRREMARAAVEGGRTSIRHVCQTFEVSQTCYRYQAQASEENARIADWLVRLTTSYRDWGFGLCFLYLRNVKGFGWNHKRVYRIYRELEQIIEWRGKPRVIRCDNGPEYISGAMLSWAERQGIRIEHIQPGKPQQNAYIERYNRTVRYGWLAQTLFDTIEQVQCTATRWLWTYNHERPNMALGGITPKQKLALAA